MGQKITFFGCKRYLCNRCYLSWPSEKSRDYYQKWCFGLEASQKDEFHSKLKENFSQEDYDYAQKVWKKFGCKNLGEYHDLQYILKQTYLYLQISGLNSGRYP